MNVKICTLGCKVNLYESEYIASLLIDNGYTIISNEEESDIYIVNTCSVTNEADKKNRKVINHIKKNYPNSILIVMGCYSQVKSNEIDADIVIGNYDKSKIIELINEYKTNKQKIIKIYDLMKVNFEPMNITNFKNHTRAFVKIQDGCNAYCSYCLIPYTRGNIRSKLESDVIFEITNLVKNGYKEIVLTGIHTGKYGLDIGSSLEHLLRELVKIPNIFRIRLSSIEIHEVTDGILDLMATNPIMANHLHIPLQSGNDEILKKMNRKYDLKYFKNRIKEIRKKLKDVAITTDLIVGFPGEDNEHFNETVNTIKEINFCKVHTFPYSKREGTPASTMKNQISTDNKKKMVRTIIDLSNNLEYNYFTSFINKTFTGITEVKKDGSVLVHTTNYIPVEINSNLDNNIEVTVKIIEVTKDNRVIGQIISEK